MPVEFNAVEFDNMDEEFEYLRHLVLGLVLQNCRTTGTPVSGRELESGFIGIHKDAMIYLGSVGLIEITSDTYGRGCTAREKKR